MSIKSAVYVRVVAGDKGRGYLVLAGFDAKLVQSNATRLVTVGTPSSRDALQAVIDRLGRELNASEVRDITAAGIAAQLKKLFEPKTEKAAA